MDRLWLCVAVQLGCWQWEQWRAAHPDAPASDAAVVVSTVSSKMLRAVAKAEGFEFHETLTGPPASQPARCSNNNLISIDFVCCTPLPQH